MSFISHLWSFGLDKILISEEVQKSLDIFSCRLMEIDLAFASAFAFAFVQRIVSLSSFFLNKNKLQSKP